jgi:hypothetical protein
MAVRTAIRRDVHTAQHERASFDESMSINADADA